MRRLPGVLFAAAALLCAACEREPSVAERQLEGTWIGTEVGSEGEWTLLVEGRSYYVKGPRKGGWFQGTFRVHETVEPPEIDLKVVDCECSFKGETSRAIYELRGDVLTLASGVPGSRERPAAFEGGEGRVLRLRRWGR